MRTLLAGLLGLSLMCVAEAAEKKDEKKSEEKPNVTALPPHPLDAVFDKATERDMTNALLNNDLYKKAMKAAIEAKKAQEQRFRDNPKLKDASPAQAARKVFLEVLMNEEKKPDEKK